MSSLSLRWTSTKANFDICKFTLYDLFIYINIWNVNEILITWHISTHGICAIKCKESDIGKRYTLSLKKLFDCFCQRIAVCFLNMSNTKVMILDSVVKLHLPYNANCCLPASSVLSSANNVNFSPTLRESINFCSRWLLIVFIISLTERMTSRLHSLVLIASEY